MSEIDVSKCEYYDDGICDKYYDIECSDHPECMYKQLQRKEQECDKLKKDVEHWKMEHKEAKAKGEWTYDLVKKRLERQLQQLKSENEKLKEKYDTLKSDNLDTIQELDNIRRRNERLEQFNVVLDEIEEIIKGFSCCEWFDNCECCELSDDKNPCLNEILQLIKQAKEGGE